jgi:hypothetical protein
MMRESMAAREPILRTSVEQARTREGADEAKVREGEGRVRDGIVVSTVMRLTTSDGRTFEEVPKAMEHEAFYQILKQLVKDLGWQDSEETASFAINLAKHYRALLPLLNQLQKDADTLRAHLHEFERSM